MNIYDIIKARNVNNLEKTAIYMRMDNGTVKSYAYDELFQKAEIYFTRLTKANVSPGDRIAICAESSPEWSISYLSIMKIHATAVLIDSALDKNEILRLIEKSELKGIFLSPKILSKLQQDMPDILIFNILNDGECLSAPSIASSNKKTVQGDEKIASIIYSSGTTKTASGIMHSHNAIIETTELCLNCNSINISDRFLAILPNSHIYGLLTQVVAPLILGAKVCYLENLCADGLILSFQDYKPTVLPAVPKIYELLQKQIIKKIKSSNVSEKMFSILFPICLWIRKKTGINLGKLFFTSIHKGFGGKLRLLCSAGAPMNKETAEFYYGTGFNLIITYGATETNIPTLGNYGKNITTDSCGKPYPGILVKFSNNGEMLIKSPYMMLGYFNDKQSTDEAFDQDGWIYTGDLAKEDEKGNIHILGRSKDNIVLSNGKKVAPDDIERNYAGILGVKDFVVCGIPASIGSYDEVHCFVVAGDDKKDNIIAQLKQKSTCSLQNMKLSGIHFVDEIPRTSLQKPKRYLLKKAIMSEPVCISQEQTACSSMRQSIFQTIAKIANVNISEISDKLQLFRELAIDSLSTVELCADIEEMFHVKIDDFINQDIRAGELADFIENPVTIKIKQKLLNIYPRKKSAMDYNIFNFFRNIICRLYNIIILNDTILPKDSGYIICANHVSNFDFLYLTVNFKVDRFCKFCCMAKKELFRNNPLNKILIKVGGMVPVDRSGIVTEAMSAIKEKLAQKWGVLIHPEGTRSKDGSLEQFKNGAAVLAVETNVPIVPAYIKGGFEVYPRSQKLPNLFNWKLLKKYKIEVIYGDPIFPKGLTAEALTIKVNEAVKALAYAALKIQSAAL